MHIPTVAKILQKTACSKKSSLSNYLGQKIAEVFFNTFIFLSPSDREDLLIFSSLITKNIKLGIVLYFILSNTVVVSYIYHYFQSSHGE